MPNYLIKATAYHLAVDVKDVHEALQDFAIARSKGTLNTSKQLIVETSEGPDSIVSLEEAFERATK